MRHGEAVTIRGKKEKLVRKAPNAADLGLAHLSQKPPSTGVWKV